MTTLNFKTQNTDYEKYNMIMGRKIVIVTMDINVKILQKAINRFTI